MKTNRHVTRLCCDCRWHILNVCCERHRRLTLCALRDVLGTKKRTIIYVGNEKKC